MTCGGGDDALCYDESPPHHDKSQPKALSEHDEAQTLQDALDTYAEREGSLADLVLAQQYRAAARRREEIKAGIRDTIERVDCVIGMNHRYPSLPPQSPISRSPGQRYELQGSEKIDETILQSLFMDADEDGLDCQRASDVIRGMRRKFMHQQALKKINSCMSVMDVDVAVQDALMYIAQVERALANAAVAFDDDESLKRVNFELNNYCVMDDGTENV